MPRDPEIIRAMESVEAARRRAAADPSRPAFHFRPPAQWMNDPNGPIHHGGFYHLFYQHNPFGDAWEHMHWGHARSRDLVSWEQLPIALRPSAERGERHCFSGCCHLDGDGRPTIIYTSVPPHESGRPQSQWAARGTADLTEWEKPATNPVLDLATHGGPALRGDWRDPYVFEHEGRTFLVLGGVPLDSPDRPAVLLYEAASPDLLRWSYRGILFEKPGDDKVFLECPSFFSLGRKWVLMVSPFRPVERWIGSFDVSRSRFVPDPGDSYGLVDHSPAYYAANAFTDERGRCILLGWVRGFPPGKGWNGCLALPRLLSLERGCLLQEPLPELTSLRGEEVSSGPFELTDAAHAVGGPRFEGDGWEIELELEASGAAETGLRILPARRDADPVTIRIAGGELEAAGIRLPLAGRPAGQGLSLRLFFDRSVLELFLDGGAECLTRVLSVALPTRLELFVRGGTLRVDRLRAWKMRPIW